MFASGLTVTRVFTAVNHIFIALYSQLDFVTKICYEMEQMEENYTAYKKLKSAALLKIKEFERRHGIKVLSIDEPLDLDISDPDVFLGRAFKYLMANQELLRIRKRTRRGIRSAMESGRVVNRAPFGYKNATDSMGKGIIIVDKERSFLIEKIFKDYLAGVPHYLIHKEVKARCREIDIKIGGEALVIFDDQKPYFCIFFR